MGKPTIREILTDFDITDPKHELLAERVEAVLKLHPKRALGLGPGCGLCRVEWPCATLRALDGER